MTTFRVFWLVLVGLLVGCGKETAPAAVTEACWLDATPYRHGESGDLWTVQMEPDGDLDDEFQVLTVTPPESFAGDSLLSVWKGRDVYMGELPVPLARKADRQWQATVNFPGCTINPDMTWSLTLRTADRALTLGSLWIKPG